MVEFNINQGQWASIRSSPNNGVVLHDEEPEEPVEKEYRILEQELLFFLNRKGYLAAYMAPANPNDITGEYVTVTRLSGSTDIRYRSDDTTLAIDCFTPNTAISGGDRFEAAKLAKKVADELPLFIQEVGWVRAIIGDIGFTDSSDSRFTYYTIIVTFRHNTE